MAGGAYANDNPFLDFLSGIDKTLGTLCDTVAPTTNDLVTGEKTLNFYSRQEQISQANAVGREHIQHLAAKGVRINDFDPAMRERASRIIDDILAVSHLRDEQWYFDFVDDPEFNAYVFGGSIIYMNRGAVENITDDEIAAIASHEIAHVALNHMFESISHRKVVERTKSKSINREWFQSAFKHEQEEEADKWGILYAALAGYDPFAAARIWQREHRKTGNYYFQRTHPMNAERAQAANQYAQQWQRYYTRGVRNPNFAKILEAQKTAPVSDNIAAGKGGGLAGCAETYAGIKGRHEAAKAEEFRQRQQFQQNNPPSIKWTMRDSCNDGQRIQYRFFARQNNQKKGVWPSNNKVYWTSGSETATLTLPCYSDYNRICYGAESNGTSWGLGIRGNKGCSNCCVSCPQYGKTERVVNMTCP